jgi:hypothetical protein
MANPARSSASPVSPSTSTPAITRP